MKFKYWVWSFINMLAYSVILASGPSFYRNYEELEHPWQLFVIVFICPTILFSSFINWFNDKWESHEE